MLYCYHVKHHNHGSCQALLCHWLEFMNPESNFLDLTEIHENSLNESLMEIPQRRYQDWQLLLWHPTIMENWATCSHKRSSAEGICWCLESIETFSGEQYHIKLASNAIPEHHAPHNVPVNLQEHFSKELDLLVSFGIIKKYDGDSAPIPWVNFYFLNEK